MQQMGNARDAFSLLHAGRAHQSAGSHEEDVFEPMFSSCKKQFVGKSAALFGSYGWGDGDWMRIWEDDCGDAGITLACESVICNEAPDNGALASCKAMGKQLAE